MSLIEKILKAVDQKLHETASAVLLRVEDRITERLKELPAPETGPSGTDGRDGRDGIDGKDALALEILPSIDEERSYPRGTWAKHKGGLWRTYEQTHGLKGWECIVNGLDCVESRIEEKTARFSIILSDGQIIEEKATLAVVMDKGVFKASTEYLAGDGVTYGGSYWISQTDNPEGRPGDSSKDWRLAVKKGRDGKDGKNGKDSGAPVKQ